MKPLLLCLLLVWGCTAAFSPLPLEDIDFTDRAQTQSQGNFQVKAAVLSASDAELAFGHPLYQKGIQPIWIEITNTDEKPTWFLPFSVDPDYFPPLEVAYYYHRSFQDEYNAKLDQYFLANQMGLFIAPGSTRSGFIFTNLDLGTKIFNLDLVGEDNQPHSFTFFISVPGLRADHEDVKFEDLYTSDQLASYDLDGFKKAMEDLAYATMDSGNEETDLPVNLIIVGSSQDLLKNLVRSDWDETASTHQKPSPQELSSIDPVKVSRYKAVSPLYYYDRPQDASFRKIKSNGLGGSVLRLWLSPVQVEGRPVWVGQVSRDIAQPALPSKNHIIDLDEDRMFFLQNLWYFQGLKQYGYLKGKEGSTLSELIPTPGKNAYLSDGYRLVLWVSGQPVPLDAVKMLDWDIPPKK